MTKAEARIRVESFLYDHIDVHNFWTDNSYEDDVTALAVLGHKKAQEACKEMGYTYQQKKNTAQVNAVHAQVLGDFFSKLS